jgi:opacity protein-like surface antigen
MKNIIPLLLLLGFSIYGFSQDNILKDSISSQTIKPKEPKKSGAKYGVRGGYNISNLDFDGTPIMKNKHRNSVFIGFFADISFSKNFSIQPEFQFSSEGAKAEPIQLDYLQTPILFKFRLADKFYFGVGPQVGLKIHKTDDGIKNMAYSGVGGVEYKVNYAIFVDARYTYGFSNVFDDNLGVTAKNSNIQLGIGYKF